MPRAFAALVAVDAVVVALITAAILSNALRPYPWPPVLVISLWLLNTVFWLSLKSTTKKQSLCSKTFSVWQSYSAPIAVATLILIGCVLKLFGQSHGALRLIGPILFVLWLILLVPYFIWSKYSSYKKP